MNILQTNETYHEPAVDAKPIDGSASADIPADFFNRCQFCRNLGPLKRVGVQRACGRCHRAVLAYFDAIVQGQVRDDFAEQGGSDAELD